MGHIPGHKQVTLYIDPAIYERVKCAAYFLSEDIFEFVSEALDASVDRRLTTAQLQGLSGMVASRLAAKPKTNGRKKKRPRVK